MVAENGGVRCTCDIVAQEKQEAWWLYVADRKKHTLITAPVLICSLKEEEEVTLHRSARFSRFLFMWHYRLCVDCFKMNGYIWLCFLCNPSFTFMFVYCSVCNLAIIW